MSCDEDLESFTLHENAEERAEALKMPPGSHPHHQITMAQKMLSACSGSLLTSVVVTPFDVVRVRLQQQGATVSSNLDAMSKNKIKNLSPSSFASSPTSYARTLSSGVAYNKVPLSAVPEGVGITACCKEVFWYPSTSDYCVGSEGTECAMELRKLNGTWDALNKITRLEGLTSLWRGLTLTLVMAVPSNVVYFIAYEHMRDNSPIKSPLLNPLICGSLARALSATVVSPLELIKTRIQSVQDNSKKASSVVYRGIREMVKSQGITSLWKGLVLTLWRDVPFSGIYWACVEFVRDQLTSNKLFQGYFENRTFEESFIAGSAGGTVAAILTTPFDVGKTRRQLCHHSATSNQMKMIPFMYHIYKTEGISALYVGVIPRVLKVAPACAIMISSYELGKKLFHDQNRNQLSLN